MKKLLLAVSVLLLNVPLVQAAGDAKRGQELYQANCTRCHDTSVHTRPNRIIHSLDGLKKRIQFCESNGRLNWSPEQIEDVAAYLNAKFYKYKEVP
ncbi:MAG: cytochrome c [Gammaproteobacteria bacterium]|nr:cytochrome c [Gammaproteobacteria bacterium]